jgi:hypothetical protein
MSNRETLSKEALLKEPIITLAALARTLNVGLGAAKSEMKKAGIEPTRLLNRREYLSVEQALALQRAMTKAATRAAAG